MYLGNIFVLSARGQDSVRFR